MLSHALRFFSVKDVLLTKTAATRNEAAFNYHRMRGLYFLAVVCVAIIVPV